MEAEFVPDFLVASKLLGMFELHDEDGIKVEAQIMLHIDIQAIVKKSPERSAWEGQNTSRCDK
ncbi:hypothetical protein KXD40_009224 [Peronospora effusa]|nr:hypothetical protein KXD40_009224 [Peronospora effusa]